MKKRSEKKAEKARMKEEKKAEKAKKKRNRKEKETFYSNLKVLNIRNYDYELQAFIMKSGYLDIMEIEPRDRDNLQDDAVTFDVYTMASFYRLYSSDIKFITLNFPISTEPQQEYLKYIYQKTNDEVRRKWLLREIRELEKLDNTVKRREFYMMVFSATKEDVLKNRNEIIIRMGYGKSRLVKEMTDRKKIEILRKICNMNTAIDANSVG